MKKQENKWSLLVGLLAAFILGGIFVFGAFPRVETVTKTIEVPKIVEVEVPKTVTETVTQEVFTPNKVIDDAWQYVLDNYNSNDYDDYLKKCNGRKYDLDEIEWEIKDHKILNIRDWSKPDYTYTFYVEGNYDDGRHDCEQLYKIDYTQYKDRDPRVRIVTA